MKAFPLRTARLALPLAVALLAAGCKKETPEDAPAGSFALEFETVAGPDPLVLNTATFTKADGQTYKVTKFKYLLSNVKLLRADGTSYAVPDSYYLIDAEKPASSHVVIGKVPLGTYSGLSFVVGVDVAHNNAAFQVGDLNHSNDMYWEWSTEYVFLKMAGTSPQAPAGRALTFDIGGNDCARVVSPSFNGASLPVAAGHVPEVHLKVDVNGMFNSTVPAKVVKFDQTYSVESGHPWAPLVADNYAAGMFTVAHIHAN